MAIRWSFDAKCLELVEHFLSHYLIATTADKNDLAQKLQDICEDKCREFDALVEANTPSHCGGIAGAVGGRGHERA